jgi:hypothetical protein
MSNFEEFAAKAHQKRVTHFVHYCTSTKRAPCVADAIEIFGFCEADAKPIVEDAIQRMAA